MRILVTGSREWTNEFCIVQALNDAWSECPANERFVIVHGDCPRGADAIADSIARFMQRLWASWQIERHPADWEQYGKRAGFLRNTEMVKAGADICLAFIKDNSRGATHCAAEAERAGIPVRRYHE